MLFSVDWHTMRMGLTVVVVSTGLAGSPALAQGHGDGFLFGPPSGMVTLRVGEDRPNASSDVFSSITSKMTVDRSDFHAIDLAGDFALQVSGRLQAVVSVGHARSSTDSEFRNYTDNNNQPIEQKTTFARLPITLSAKFYLTEPGKSIGRTAWIPARIAPYVGAGGGAMWYRLRQSGDFIDFNTMNVFSDTFNSQGFAPAATAFTGFDVTLNPRWALTVDGRYTWAKKRLDPDFSGFAPIDLSGLTVTTGLSIRF